MTATTKYVASSRLKRQAADVTAATERLERFLATATELEPTSTELQFAAQLEGEANRAGLALDSGESQLCAIAIHRAVPAILTGDKRAIAAAESLLAAIPRLHELALRIACLEQAVTLAVHRLGALDVRGRVIAEPQIDKAVSICFQFTNPSVPETFTPAGLVSYINSVRSSAPTLLMPGDVLAVSSVSEEGSIGPDEVGPKADPHEL